MRKSREPHSFSPTHPELRRRFWSAAIGLAVSLSGVDLPAESSPAVWRAAANGVSGSALTIARVACVTNRVTLEFETPEPASRHEILQSRDLHRWRLVPDATFESTGGQDLSACLEGVSDATAFYRVLCLGASPAPVYVNIQVDAELQDTQGLRNLVDELQARGISSTVYVTAEYANRNATLITELFRRGFEIALHGYYTGEQLATMTYVEQKDLLTRAKQAVEGCRPCGTYRPVIGFRPQYFSQNEDTFRVLDELGLTHNSGFKVGQIYLPGHEEDALPYQVDGHLFFAIPITTIQWEAERVYLCDIACAQALNWPAAQWGEALMLGLTSAVATRRPLVLLVHGWYTGDNQTYQYWQPFLDFLDAAQGRVTFVNSTELVDLVPTSPAPPGFFPAGL